MRFKQWNADLTGLDLKQSNSPLTLSNQKNVTIKNIALPITRYSKACIFKLFQKCQFDPGWRQFCNSSLFLGYNRGLRSWLLQSDTITKDKVNNRWCYLPNLVWPSDLEMLQKFLQLCFCYPLHFYREVFKKKKLVFWLFPFWAWFCEIFYFSYL